MKSFIVIVFIISISTVSYAKSQKHSHGVRSHAHQLPHQGIKHRHGNSQYGSQLNSNNYAISNTRMSDKELRRGIATSKPEGITDKYEQEVLNRLTGADKIEYQRGLDAEKAYAYAQKESQKLKKRPYLNKNYNGYEISNALHNNSPNGRKGLSILRNGIYKFNLTKAQIIENKKLYDAGHRGHILETHSMINVLRNSGQEGKDLVTKAVHIATQNL